MSKLYDVKRMYGQDFGIAVTNASADILNATPSLMKNMLLISSPESDSKGNDSGIVTLFVTDYEGSPVQLTYPIYEAKGLKINEKGALELMVDGSTLKEDKATGMLYADGTQLSLATSNYRGVVKVGDTIERDEETITTFNYNKSGISITDDGTLFIKDDFIQQIHKHFDLLINEKIKPLIQGNISLIVLLDGVQYTTSQNITISPPDIIVTRNMSLSFVSTSPNPITVDIDVAGKVELSMTQMTTSVSSTPKFTLGDDYKQYSHEISGIVLTALPNYYFSGKTPISSTSIMTITLNGLTELDNASQNSIQIYTIIHEPLNQNTFSFAPNTNVIRFVYFKEEDKEEYSLSEFSIVFNYNGAPTGISGIGLELTVRAGDIVLYNDDNFEFKQRQGSFTISSKEIDANTINQLINTSVNVTGQLLTNAPMIMYYSLQFNINGETSSYEGTFNIEHTVTKESQKDQGVYILDKITIYENDVITNIGLNSETNNNIECQNLSSEDINSFIVKFVKQCLDNGEVDIFIYFYVNAKSPATINDIVSVGNTNVLENSPTINHIIKSNSCQIQFANCNLFNILDISNIVITLQNNKYSNTNFQISDFSTKLNGDNEYINYIKKNYLEYNKIGEDENEQYKVTSKSKYLKFSNSEDFTNLLENVELSKNESKFYYLVFEKGDQKYGGKYQISYDDIYNNRIPEE